MTVDQNDIEFKKSRLEVLMERNEKEWDELRPRCPADFVPQVEQPPLLDFLVEAGIVTESQKIDYETLCAEVISVYLKKLYIDVEAYEEQRKNAQAAATLGVRPRAARAPKLIIPGQ